MVEEKSIFAKRMEEAFENVACLGRDAFGRYIDKMVKYAENQLEEEILRRESRKQDIV